MHGVTRRVMNGIVFHDEAALWSAVVQLSATAIAERMLPYCWQLSSDA